MKYLLQATYKEEEVYLAYSSERLGSWCWRWLSSGEAPLSLCCISSQWRRVYVQELLSPNRVGETDWDPITPSEGMFPMTQWPPCKPWLLRVPPTSTTTLGTQPPIPVDLCRTQVNHIQTIASNKFQIFTLKLVYWVIKLNIVKTFHTVCIILFHIWVQGNKIWVHFISCYFLLCELFVFILAHMF